jgi:hypothetical protein
VIRQKQQQQYQQIITTTTTSTNNNKQDLQMETDKQDNQNQRLKIITVFMLIYVRSNLI